MFLALTESLNPCFPKQRILDGVEGQETRPEIINKLVVHGVHGVHSHYNCTLLPTSIVEFEF
jgi:hypothetical protein